MKRFQDWYPQVGPANVARLRDNCSTVYEHFKTALPVPGDRSALARPLISCLLEYTPDQAKANMATAGVLLGLLPTLLAYFGSNTAETGLLAMKRPFLALLISAGTPAVWPVRTFDYLRPIEVLRGSPERVSPPKFSKPWRTLISVLEYLIVLGAVGNLYYTIVQFTIQTVDSSAAETQYMSIMYVLFGIPIHVLGAVVVALQIEFHPVNSKIVHPKTKTSLWPAEFKICIDQAPSTVRTKKETYTYLALSWFMSVAIILHLLLGTVVLAGALFISVADAVSVAGRLIASTLICRVVLMFELSGLRETVTVKHTGV